MSLEDLRARAQSADAGKIEAPQKTSPPGAPPPGDAPPAAADPLLEATLRYGAVLRTIIPERARPHWTDERLRELGLELSNCARHYGWTFGALVNHPLARLGAAAGALAWPIAEPWAKPLLLDLLGKRSPARAADPPAAAPPGDDAPPPPPASPIKKTAPLA